MKKILLCLVLLLILAQALALPVFPTAEGFGTQTPAGRGGTVYKVTNLNASGPGSLNECVEASGPRVCIFEVSGNIEHYGGLNIRNPYITIAGQTAPSPGITLKGTTLTIFTHDVLIQHIRVRTGDNELGYSPDSRHVVYLPSSASPYNVVLDHCSFSWGIDEIISATGHNLTVSNSIISEALNASLHPKGPHPLGILLGADNSSWIRNLIAHTANRNPVVDAPRLLIVNHIGYNLVGKYGCAPTISGSTPKEATIIGSGTYRGPDSGSGEFPCVNATYLVYVNKVSSAGFDLYAEDNECENRDEDPWSCVYVYASNVRQASSPPVWVEPLTVLSSAEALPWVLNNSGARPADRDSAYIRVINNVRNRDGQFIDCVTPEPIYYPTGSVVSATSDTITFPAATIFMYDDGYNGKVVEITSGTGNGQNRTITDYAGKFGSPNYTATVDPGWDITPDSTSEFRIITDCTKNAGGWPDLAENYRALTIPNNPNQDDDGDGYTNLEEWLHNFSAVVEGRVILEEPEPIPGDLNNDGVVDIQDLTIVATNFGLTTGFEQAADTDSNNVIDIFDIVFVASRFT